MTRRTFVTSLTKMTLRGGPLDDAALMGFRKTLLRSMSEGMAESGIEISPAIARDIDTLVAKEVFDAADTRLMNGLIKNMDSNSFDAMLRNLHLRDSSMFRRLVDTIPDADLRLFYRELDSTTNAGKSLRKSLDDAAKNPLDTNLTSRGSTWAWLAETGDGSPVISLRQLGDNPTNRQLVDAIDLELNIRGADTPAEKKAWLGKAIRTWGPTAVVVYYVMDITHAVTGIPYADLIAALFKPSTLFGYDGDGSGGGGSTCSISNEDGTAITTKTDCEAVNGDWESGGDGGLLGGGVISTLGIVMIGLIGVVGLSFVMQLMRTMTGK